MIIFVNTFNRLLHICRRKSTKCGLEVFQKEDVKNGNFFSRVFIVFYNVPYPKVLFDYSTKISVPKFLPWDLLKKTTSFIV